MTEGKVSIHFNDVDHAGRLYFANASDIAHRLLEEYWKKSELGWEFWFDNPEWTVPIVNSQCNFFSEVLAGDELNYEIKMDNMGSTSISIRFNFFKNATKCFEVTTTHVFVDKKSGKPISIPENVKNQFN